MAEFTEELLVAEEYTPRIPPSELIAVSCLTRPF